MALYQNKQISSSGIVRPKYGVIRAIYASSPIRNTYEFYNDTSATGNPIHVVAPAGNNPIAEPTLAIPFSALFIKVTGTADEQISVHID